MARNKMSTIQQEAHQWMIARGHEIDKFRSLTKWTAEAKCIHCGRAVVVNTLIGKGLAIGEGIAADCDTPREHNPDTCGCKYLGFGLWDCGHTDQH